MPMLAIPFPSIDPVLVEFGPLAIRWYSLAYIAGFLIGWWLAKRLINKATLWRGNQPPFDAALVDDAIVYAALAGILGGRLGFVFIYNLPYFLEHPKEIIAVWEGGMSFHGGILGCIFGLWLFARKSKTSFLQWMDITAIVAPIGIALGRLANFIKPELWGRVSDVPWAMVFPGAGDAPRHPSQLYQMAIEGGLLFLILFVLAQNGGLKRRGFMAGAFGIGYGLARIFGEFFREPDPQLGFLWGGATMGQVLSLPFIAIGLWLIVRSRKEL